MTPRRPVYLNLFAIRLPLPGMVSFAHRVSGVLMILAIPFFLYALEKSLGSPQGFAEVGDCLSHWLVKLGLLVIAWSLFHHLFAGIRFLLIDIDVGVDLKAARLGSWIVFAASIAATVLALGLIWGAIG